MFTIPQCSPRANYLIHKEEIDRAIARVLESGSYILGDEVEAFEKEFAAEVGVAQYPKPACHAGGNRSDSHKGSQPADVPRVNGC